MLQIIWRRRGGAAATAEKTKVIFSIILNTARDQIELFTDV